MRNGITLARVNFCLQARRVSNTDWDSLTQALFPEPSPATMEESPSESCFFYSRLESLWKLPWVGPFNEHLLRLLLQAKQAAQWRVDPGEQTSRTSSPILHYLICFCITFFTLFESKYMHVISLLFTLSFPKRREGNEVEEIEIQTWRRKDFGG